VKDLKLSPACGITKKIERRIVNGNEATKIWGWQV
jgi:hypothetical protein